MVKIINDAAEQAGVKVISIEKGGKHIKVYVIGKFPAMVTVSLSPRNSGHFMEIISRDMKRVTSQPQRGY
jgi:hypothetical protein